MGLLFAMSFPLLERRQLLVLVLLVFSNRHASGDRKAAGPLAVSVVSERDRG